MELIDISIEDIVVRKMIRCDMGDLQTLQNSIRQLGLLFPVLVNRKNILLSGSRRVAACRAVGLSTIPALVLDVHEDDMAALDIQCQENYCRKELTLDELESEIDMKKARLKRTRKTVVSGGVSGVRAWLASKFRRTDPEKAHDEPSK